MDTVSVTENAGESRRKTRIAWKCSVCGYIETRYPEGLPEGYRCPMCNAKPKKFKMIEIEA